MNILILGGFLGSGKTSFLLELAHYIAENSDRDNSIKIAVIENEIGEIGIDGMTLGGTGLVVKDIFSGCVCCTLSSDLVGGVAEIQQRLSPEWVIIETTGLAFPDKVAKAIESYVDYDRMLIAVLADASRWEELFDILNPLVTGQVKAAHMILLNKTDLVSSTEREQIISDLRKLNPSAGIFSLSVKIGVPDSVFEKILSNQTEGN